MPKSVLKNPYQDASILVFGQRGERNLKFVAKKAGIPHSSCLAYRDNIERMPLERFALVCEANRLTDAEIAEVVRMFYRG